MALYTFYPCKADGAADTFVSFELVDDDDARIRALHVLDQHSSASYVAIWCGERKVGRRHRDESDRQSRAPEGASFRDS